MTRDINFSKVLYVVTLYSEYTRALTFQNFFGQAAARLALKRAAAARAAAAYSGSGSVCVCLYTHMNI